MEKRKLFLQLFTEGDDGGTGDGMAMDPEQKVEIMNQCRLMTS